MTKSKDKDKRKHKDERRVKELRKEIEGMTCQWTEELSVLKGIASVVNQPLPLDQILKAIAETVLEAIPPAQRVVIHLCSEAANILVPIANVQRDRSMKRAPPIEIMQTIARRAARKRQRIYIPNFRKESRLSDQKGELSMLVIPLVSDRKIVGTLSVYGAGAEAFSDHDQCLTEILAGWTAIVIKKTQLRFEVDQARGAALTVLAKQSASA